MKLAVDLARDPVSLNEVESYCRKQCMSAAGFHRHAQYCINTHAHCTYARERKTERGREIERERERHTERERQREREREKERQRGERERVLKYGKQRCAKL